MITEEQRQAVIVEARSWLGTPYHTRANLKGVGVDCAWLLIEVYAAAGVIERFDPGAYPHDWHLHRSDERYLEHVTKHAHQTDQPREGDLMVVQFGRTFSHGAIVLPDGLIIHSYVGRGCELAELSEFSERNKKFFTL